MPAIAAHYYFGQAVQQQLPQEIAQVLASNQNLFILGCQGPDFLFFAKPLTGARFHKLGSAIHSAPARVLFDSNLKLYNTTGNAALLAYIAGCLCHFWLDKSCHPFVYEHAPQMGQHHRLESEFDSLIIEKQGLNPAKYCYIPISEVDYGVVGMAYNLTPKEAKRGVRDFRKYSSILHHRKFVEACESIAGKKGALSGLSPQKELIYTDYCQALYDMLESSISGGADLICQFVQASNDSQPLGGDFNYNFEGELHENDQA